LLYIIIKFVGLNGSNIMQFNKILRNIIFCGILYFYPNGAFSQETNADSLKLEPDTIINQPKKKEFKLFKIFKHKKTESEVDNTTSNLGDDKKNNNSKKRFTLFRKNNKKDTVIADSIYDTTELNETDTIININKNDTSGGNTVKKPKRILPWKWNKMNSEEQDSLLSAWDEYDREQYKKKYAFTKNEVKIALKRDRTFFEKQIYKRARTKPFRHRKKLIERKNSRYQKTMLYERFDKSNTAPKDSISDKERYISVNKQFKRDAKRETIRKNKVVILYDRKEEKLKRKYELTDDETKILNKGKGMKLKGSELLTFQHALKKQEKFTDELLILRKKRNFELQNKKIQKKMKEKEKQNKSRDKELMSKIFKKKSKKNNNKHDSDEYPKRYF